MDVVEQFAPDPLHQNLLPHVAQPINKLCLPPTGATFPLRSYACRPFCSISYFSIVPVTTNPRHNIYCAFRFPPAVDLTTLSSPAVFPFLNRYMASTVFLPRTSSMLWTKFRGKSPASTRLGMCMFYPTVDGVM